MQSQKKNMRKTITFADVMNYPEQPAPSSQENDTTSEDNSSDSDEFGAFVSTTLVDFTNDSECEEKDGPLLREIHREFDEAIATSAALGTASTSSNSTNLINNQDERHEEKARRRLPTTESSTAKAGKSKIPVKASQTIKSTPNDRCVIPNHPTTSSQSTSQKRSILVPKNECKTSRTKADQMQCASLSTRNAKLSPPAAAKKEERGLLRAPVAKQQKIDVVRAPVTIDAGNNQKEDQAKEVAPRALLTTRTRNAKIDLPKTTTMSTAYHRDVAPKRSTMDSQPTLRQRATVKDESNLVRKKDGQIQKCTSLSMSKAKLPPALVAKNEEIVLLTDELAAVKSELVQVKRQLRQKEENPQLAIELAAVQSELAKTKHELRIHEQNECELWGALNDDRQAFNDSANEKRNLESAVENMMVENTRQSHLIDQLHVTIYESDKKCKQLVLTHEETRSKWNARQMAAEDQLSHAHERLEVTQEQLHDALMASHQLDVQVNSLQNILHRLVQEREVSTVGTLVLHPEIIASTHDNQRPQLLALQSNRGSPTEEKQVPNSETQSMEDVYQACSPHCISDKLSIQQFQSKYDGLHAQVQSHDSTMEEMRRNKNDAVDELKADNERLQAKNEALSGMLQEFEAMCDELHAQVQSHDSTMEEMRRNKNDAVDELKADNERLQAKNEALSGMLQEFEAMCDELHAQVQSHDSTMEEMRRNKNDAVDELKADNERLQAKNEALSGMLQEFEAMCDELHAQVQSHDSTMEEMRRNKNDAMDELDHVRADLEVAQATVKQLQRVHDLVDDIDL
ncbi:hypothetical protein AC1031_013364 [Aphanomyces cochlioides]|nr:hypothetical protein AC1031_013364 [Aphanomyces cochlioides]